MNKNIVEYGHYYQTQGPTLGTLQSISLFQKLKNQGFFGESVFTVLFVDDVHEKNPHEPNSEVYDIDFKSLCFDIQVLESHTKKFAFKLINSLQQDPDLDVVQEGKKKYLKGGSKYKIQLSDEKNPSCVMMDAALTFLKMSKKTGSGLKTIINILPISYKQQQLNLHKVITELFRIGSIKEPIKLQSLLFNSDAASYELIETIHSSSKKQIFTL